MAIKTIEIGGKPYNMKASAFTLFAYKNMTGRELLDDIGKVNDVANSIAKLPQEQQDSEWMKKAGSMVDMLLKIAYVMISEYDSKFKPFDEWTKDLDGLFDDFTWIGEVLGLAMSTFRRRID